MPEPHIQIELITVERSSAKLLERFYLAPYDVKTVLYAHSVDIDVVFKLVQQVYGLPELRSDVEAVINESTVITVISDVSGAIRFLVDNCDWDGSNLRFNNLWLDDLLPSSVEGD